MIRFTFRVGLVFRELSTLWTLTKSLVTNQLQFSSETGEHLNLFKHEVHDKWMKGEWVTDERSLKTLHKGVYIATPRDLSTYPPSEQQAALRRLGYLNAVSPEATPYDPDVWSQRIQHHATAVGDPKPPCASSVQNWWRKYRHGKSINLLIPYKRRRKSHHGDERREIFHQATEEVFLTRQQVGKNVVFERVEKLVEARNSTLPAEYYVKCPARSTVYRWLSELRQEIVDGDRLGAEFARAKYRVSFGGLKVANILERVEIDHTPLDLIVIDQVTCLPIGRPWLTLSTDKASRMIFGFYLNFDTPSATSVLQCLKMGILPKTTLLSRFPDIRGQWPVHGIPDSIAIDNGMEFHSAALEQTCAEMGIEVLYCGARTPQHKGSIERLFRTINQDLIHTLPGTTFSNTRDRGDYPSEKLAAITLETLEHLLTKWIVDIYSVKRHRGISTTPLARWSEIESTRVIELPVYPQQIEVITGLPARRTIFHYGIELDSVFYNSNQLQEIRKRAGANILVDLKFYEDDVSYIHVYDPFDEEYIKVLASDQENTHGIPRKVYKLIKHKAKQDYGDSPSSAQIYQAREDIANIVKEAMKSKKMKVRKWATGKSAKSVEPDPSTQSLDDVMRPISDKTKTRPANLPSGLDDDLPAIGLFGHNDKNEPA